MIGRKARWALLLAAGALLVPGCSFRRNPLEMPIISDSQQPDKELFERAASELERSRYMAARLILQTLLNTYPDSEYLAKAKLAIADSWYREGGSSNLLQAEAEYRDFITFFPTMPEAAEAQMRVAMIHYLEMEKPDRDPTHARRAEQELQKLLLNYPESAFLPIAEQRLREVQEVIAQGAFEVGRFYFIQGADRAAQPRLKELVERYPYYSQADTALYLLGRSLERTGAGDGAEAVTYYSRIVRDYPLSGHTRDAKQRLAALNAPVPEPDPAAVARMTYEEAHAKALGLFDKMRGAFHRRPNVSAAQGRQGPPTMTAYGPAQAGAFPSSEPEQGPPAGTSSPPRLSLEPIPQGSSPGP